MRPALLPMVWAMPLYPPAPFAHGGEKGEPKAPRPRWERGWGEGNSSSLTASLSA
jgi:hypothetical protein